MDGLKTSTVVTIPDDLKPYEEIRVRKRSNGVLRVTRVRFNSLEDDDFNSEYCNPFGHLNGGGGVGVVDSYTVDPAVASLPDPPAVGEDDEEVETEIPERKRKRATPEDKVRKMLQYRTLTYARREEMSETATRYCKMCKTLRVRADFTPSAWRSGNYKCRACWNTRPNTDENVVKYQWAMFQRSKFAQLNADIAATFTREECMRLYRAWKSQNPAMVAEMKADPSLRPKFQYDRVISEEGAANVVSIALNCVGFHQHPTVEKGVSVV